MAHWAHKEAKGFPDMLPRINKHEPDKTAPFHSHIMKQ